MNVHDIFKFTGKLGACQWPIYFKILEIFRPLLNTEKSLTEYKAILKITLKACLWEVPSIATEEVL
jgi:hypothetical protein